MSRILKSGKKMNLLIQVLLCVPRKSLNMRRTFHSVILRRMIMISLIDYQALTLLRKPRFLHPEDAMTGFN